MKTMVYSKKLILLAAMSVGTAFGASKPVLPGCVDTQKGWSWGLIARGAAVVVPVAGILGYGAKLGWARWHRVTPTAPIVTPPSDPAAATGDAGAAPTPTDYAGCLEALRKSHAELESKVERITAYKGDGIRTDAQIVELGAQVRDTKADLAKSQLENARLQGVIEGLRERASINGGSSMRRRSFSGRAGDESPSSPRSPRLDGDLSPRRRAPGAGGAAGGAGLSGSGLAAEFARSTPGHPSHAEAGRGAGNPGGAGAAALSGSGAGLASVATPGEATGAENPTGTPKK